jgi:hypothetical protein
MERSSPKLRAKERVEAGRGPEYFASEFADLLKLDTATLRRRWASVFDANPSRHFGHLFMVRTIAHRLQEKTSGGLKRSTERLLDRVCDGPTKIVLARLPKTAASAGTVLIREWRGVRHRVSVLDHDVVYRGQRYKSLSQVARLITGSRWSGPLFFGLRRRAKEVSDE